MKKHDSKFKTSLLFNYTILIFSLAFFILNLKLTNKNVSANSAVNFQIQIFYARETHQIDTTQPFTETLLNPNGSSLDIDLPADVLSSGEAVELVMYSTPKESVTDDQPLSGGKLGANIFYNLSFKKVSDGSPVTSFDKDISLTLNYTDDDISGMDEDTLTIYRWNGSEWIALSDSVVDADLNEITATSRQFSYFGILGDPFSSCGNNIKEVGEQCDGTDLAGGICSDFGFTAGTLTCNANCTFNTSACTSGGGGRSRHFVTTPQTTVSFSGRAYPNTAITLLKDAQIVAVTVAGPDSKFQITLTSLSAGNYIFSLYSKDGEGQRSSLFTFSVSVTEGVTIDIGGIFISPTINIDKSEVRWGENLIIFGQSVSQGEVTIVVNSEQNFFAKTQTDEDGIYLHNFDTTVLEMGQHFTKSKASIDEEVSSFSKSVGFLVGTKTTFKEKTKTFRGDVNNDKRVNLVDFSIAAYWYKKPAPPSSVDINNDDKIDLADFSIMAFHWTG